MISLEITNNYTVRSKQGLIAWISDDNNDVWQSNMRGYLDTVIQSCKINDYDLFADLSLVKLFDVNKDTFEKFCRFIKNAEAQTEQEKQNLRILLLASMLLTSTEKFDEILSGCDEAITELSDQNEALRKVLSGYQGEKISRNFLALKRTAEQGDATAQFNLGVCYANGNGVDQNYKEAFKWYRKAAEQGLAEAQYNLGCCYANGFGVEQNIDEAFKRYKKAAGQGHVYAQEEIAVKNLLDKHHIDYKMFCIAYDNALKRIKNKDK